MIAVQAAEASGSEEEASEAAPGEEEREEGEIVPPATPIDKKAQRLQARRAAAQAAADELKVRLPSVLGCSPLRHVLHFYSSDHPGRFVLEQLIFTPPPTALLILPGRPLNTFAVSCLH